MTKEEQKDVKGSVSKDVWRKLRIIAIQKDVSLPDLIRDVLERFANSKKVEGVLGVEESQK